MCNAVDLLAAAYNMDPIVADELPRPIKKDMLSKMYKYWQPDLPPIVPFSQLRMDEVATLTEATDWLNRSGWMLGHVKYTRRLLDRMNIPTRLLIRYAIVQIDHLETLCPLIPELPFQPITLDRLVSAEEASDISGLSRLMLYRHCTENGGNIVAVKLHHNASDLMYVTSMGGAELMRLDLHDRLSNMVMEGVLEAE